MRKSLNWLLAVLVVLLPASYLLARANYLLFHTVTELITAVIGVLIFLVSLIPHSFKTRNLLVLLGPGLLASSLVCILHILTYEGFHILGPSGTNVASQYWLVMQLILSMAFLYAALHFRRRYRYWLATTLAVGTAAVLSALVYFGAFPAAFVPGSGLTQFKLVAEAVIILVFCATVVALWRPGVLEKPVRTRLLAALGLLIAAETFFSVYTDIHDLTNFLGHYAKLAAFLILYETLFFDVIVEPFRAALYSGVHDDLTGVYNRRYLETEMALPRSQPAGVAIFNIDGLKLINETYGHEAGDRTLVAEAKLVEKALEGRGSLARIGGDEFAVVIERNPADTLPALVETVLERAGDTRGGPDDPVLSLSSGYAVQKDAADSLYETFRQAEDQMRREKLLNQRSSRSAIVKTLLKTLETRDLVTNDHSARMVPQLFALAKACGVSDNRRNELQLFADFHDIGKVGIPDRILFKPGPLTPEERVEMQRHSELGYEIAISSPEIAHISDWILKHQERWDGKGYPLGLAGEQIPLECRILSVVDAFDAMTHDRPYRQAMGVEQALAELQAFAGTQFDPAVVERFVALVARGEAGPASAP